MGDTVLISTDFLTDLLADYYIIDDHSAIDLYDIEPAKRRLKITGTMKMIDLFRKIESLTGCYFKRHYYIENNQVKARIELLKPKRYGRLHTAPVEAIKLGRNTNKLEYTTNEENNALAVAPIMNKDNSKDEKDIEYTQMIKDWMKITANVDNNSVDMGYAPSDFDNTIDTSSDHGYGLYENGINGVKITKETRKYDTMPYMVIKQEGNYIPIAEEANNPILHPPKDPDGDRQNELTDSDQIINPEFYLGKTRPKLIVRKLPGSTAVSITIRSTNIVEDTEIVQHITFKDNVLWDNNDHVKKTAIENRSPIIIDCNKQTINYTRVYWPNTEITTTKTVPIINKTKKKTSGNTAPLKYGVYCTCGKYAYGKRYFTIFKNECPFCHGKLKWHQSTGTRGSGEKELRCKSCGADFCGACGRDKAKSRRRTLTKVKSIKTDDSSGTKEETIKIKKDTWMYVEMTLYPNDTVEDLKDENKAKLNEYCTADSDFFTLHGNVTIELKGCYVNLDDDFLTANNAKLYDCAEFPFIKNQNKSYFSYDKEVPFNYKKINNIPKIANVNTSSDTVEDILIDCWNYAEGKNNDTKMLELIEDIELDLVDKDNTIYNAGDFVYLKGSNNKTYEAQITETTKNPNKRGEGSVNVGQVINTPINTFMG